MADGAARFRQGFSGPALLRILLGNSYMPITGLSPSMADFPKSFFYITIFHIAVLQPLSTRTKVWPLPRSLATTCGITFVFFSSPYLDVSVREVGNYCSQIFNLWGFPIRTRADCRSFAPPRAFSQLTTSFVAPGSQGIPHTPLFTSISLPG